MAKLRAEVIPFKDAKAIEAPRSINYKVEMVENMVDVDSSR